jgi:hypothetical protein
MGPIVANMYTAGQAALCGSGAFGDCVRALPAACRNAVRHNLPWLPPFLCDGYEPVSRYDYL